MSDVAEAEKAKQLPETGAENTNPVAPPVSEPPAEPSGEPAGEDHADELAKWKAMSRKNEKQAEANLRQAEQYQAELAKVKADNALLKAKSLYPQITDESFAALYRGNGTPEDIADWAEQYAKYNPIKVGGKPAVREYDHVAVQNALNAENPQGAVNPAPKRGDAYKRGMNRQRARARTNK